MGRSESRGALRRHFEVDAECITLATLYQLKKQGKCDGQCVANAVKDLGIDPEKISALVRINKKSQDAGYRGQGSRNFFP